MAGVPFLQVEFPSPHRALFKLQPSYFASNPQVRLSLNLIRLPLHSTLTAILIHSARHFV